MKPTRLGCLSSILIFGAALSSLVIPRTGAGNADATGGYCICAVQFGYHSALILPVETPSFSWRSVLRPAETNVQYLGFSWGERQWYVNPPTTNRTLESLRALFLPNRAVLKVERYSAFPSEQRSECIRVTPEHYLKLVAFIQQSFERDEQNAPIFVATDAVHPARFYAATGIYSLFNNCNHWTAEGLRMAGATTPLWPAHAAAILWVLHPTCNDLRPARLTPGLDSPESAVLGCVPRGSAAANRNPLHVALVPQ